jgi:hypothetical protein
MATTQFAFCRVGLMQYGNVTPVAITGYGVSSESVSVTGSNQTTTATAPETKTGGGYPFCRVSTDTAVYVAFGSAPNALTGTTTRFMLPAGAVDYFAVTPGDKAAVVTV